MNRNTSLSLPPSHAERDRERRVFRFLRLARIPGFDRRMPRPLACDLSTGIGDNPGLRTYGNRDKVCVVDGQTAQTFGVVQAGSPFCGPMRPARRPAADLAAKPCSTPLSTGQEPPPSRRSGEIVNRAGAGRRRRSAARPREKRFHVFCVTTAAGSARDDGRMARRKGQETVSQRARAR